MKWVAKSVQEWNLPLTESNHKKLLVMLDIKLLSTIDLGQVGHLLLVNLGTLNLATL